MTTSPPKQIVIIGGGIAGVSTAFYLTRHPALPTDAKITIVEGTDIAAAASGKSGGFLAKDWHGSATASLSAMSYDLHKELADEFGGEKWGYRTVDTLSITTDATRKTKKPSPLPWLPNNVLSSRTLGDKSTNAQVHPGLLTKFLADQVLSKPNTSLVTGHAKRLTTPASTEASGSSTRHIVKVQKSNSSEEVDIPADAVVIAAGPWTGQLAVDLLGKKIGSRLGVEGHRAHSVVVRTKEDLSAHCLFTSMTLPDGSMGEPEVYARPDDPPFPYKDGPSAEIVHELLLMISCGAGDNEPLPATAAEVTPSKSAITKLHTQARTLSSVFDPASGAEIIAEQACFLPIATRGRPLVGKVEGVEGVYIGSGLSCWGITQGPGTGKCLAELILEGRTKSADISKLAP